MPHGRRDDVRRVWSDARGQVDEPELPAETDPVGPVRVRLSTSGRRGKTVTVVSGLPAAERRDTARRLKRACGSGGAVKGDDVEIQGDHRDAVIAALGERFTVRPG